ncbi:MFS transporter [Bradyrhizobium sp. 14AA]
MSRFRAGRNGVVLGVCHVAGMLDMVALPVWIGTFVQFYRLSPAEAGATVTSFLASVVLASLMTARFFARLNRRAVVVGGFAVASASFACLATVPPDHASLSLLTITHAIAGVAAGSALSITHGTIGQTENPHRLFGLVNVTLAIFGIAFFAVVPALIHAVDPTVLFQVFAGGMAVAAAVALLAFPSVHDLVASRTATDEPIHLNAWLIVGTVICMTFNQALIFSFLERIGDQKGFSQAGITAVLVTLGFINLLPGLLAALTQKRLSPISVGIVGPLLQGALAILIVNATNFAIYAAVAVPYVSIVIFTHTFLFGLLSQVDEGRRALAATPAMMMLGSAAGPAVGGAIVQSFGYAGLGYAAAATSTLAVVLMAALKSRVGPSLVIVESA